MVVIYYASDIVGCGRRTCKLSNAPLHLTRDANSIDKYTLKS